MDEQISEEDRSKPEDRSRRSGAEVACISRSVQRIIPRRPNFMRPRALIRGGTANRKALLRTVLVLLLFCALTACKTSQDAVVAANQLALISQQLAAYYADLDQQMRDTISLNQMQSDLLGVPSDQTDLDRFSVTRDELAKRAAMAHALGALAQAYAGLAGSKAGSDVGTAASAFATELAAIKAIPGGPGISSLVTQASGALVELIRAHKLQQSSGKIAEVVSAVDKLFQKESKEVTVYQSINKQRVELAESLAILMVEKNLVDVSPSLAPALKPFGLSAKLPAGPASADVRHLTEAEIKSSSELQIRDYNATTKSLAASLAAVANQVDAVAKEKAKL